MSEAEQVSAGQEAPVKSQSETVNQREAVKAAAQAAIDADTSAQPGSETTHFDPAQEDKPAVEKKSAAAEEPDNKKAIFVRAKKQAQRMREQAQAEYNTKIQAAEDRAKQLEAQHAEYQRKVMLAQDNPDAVREIGLNPSKIVQAAIQAAQPDPLRDAQLDWQKKYGTVEEKLAALEQLLEKQQKLQVQQESKQVVDEFVGYLKTNEESYPTLNAIYGDDHGELVDKANALAIRYKENTGRVAKWDDLLEYLESLENSKYSRIQKHQAASNKAPPKGKPANGTRVLSTADSSQRASTPMPIEKMTESQRRDYLKSVVEKAMREDAGKQ